MRPVEGKAFEEVVHCTHFIVVCVGLSLRPPAPRHWGSKGEGGVSTALCTAWVWGGCPRPLPPPLAIFACPNSLYCASIDMPPPCFFRHATQAWQAGNAPSRLSSDPQAGLLESELLDDVAVVPAHISWEFSAEPWYIAMQQVRFSNISGSGDEYGRPQGNNEG